MDNGFITIHRKMLTWEWYTDGNTFRLFIHLLLKANHKENNWKGIVIERGQLVTGRKVLAEELGMTERQIRTSLNHLKSTNELTIKATNKYSIVTIVNYGLYQDLNTRVTNKTTDKSPTNDHQSTTNNNDNNNNNKYIVDYLNEKAGKSFKHNSKKTSSLISARIKEGYSVVDFEKVINIKCSQWINTTMEQYLRPETLFGTKFESYLNEKVKSVEFKKAELERIVE